MESLAQDLQLEAALLPKLSLEGGSAAPCHGLSDWSQEILAPGIMDPARLWSS